MERRLQSKMHNNNKNWDLFHFSWSEDPKRDLSSYFSTISDKHFDIDPYWMIGPDSSDVDRKKSVKVISGLENIEGNVYEAVLNLNGQKEAIVSHS